MVQVLDPKNPLGTTAGAAAVTASTKPVSSLGPEEKHNLRSIGGESKNDVIYSRLRRHSLRNISYNRIGNASPNLPRLHQSSRAISLSAYPVPDPSDASKDTEIDHKGYDGRKFHIKSTVSKLALLSHSQSTPPPIIYDTIEVMLEPPPKLWEKEFVSGKKRNPKSTVRRSKRRKLGHDDQDGSLHLESMVSDGLNRHHETVKTELVESISQVNEDVNDPVAPLVPIETSTTENLDEDSFLTQEQERALSDVTIDLTPATTPKQLLMPFHDDTRPSEPNIERLRSPLPSTPEPMEPTSAHTSSTETHESEDINDWLMTDIDQSVEEDPVSAKEPVENYDSLSPERLENVESNDDASALVVDDNVSVVSDKLVSDLLAAAAIIHEQPTTVDEAEKMEVTEEDQDRHSESHMDLDLETPYDNTPKPSFQTEPLTTLIDEARLSLAGSVVESPSPPLRTLLSKQVVSRPTSSPVTEPPNSPSLKESFRSPDLGSGETQEPVEDFLPSASPMQRDSPGLKQTSPYPKFDVPSIRPPRSTRPSMRYPMELQRRPPNNSLDLATSVNPSGASSSLSSPISLPTPPGPSPSPAIRAASPSFGLRTTPWPMGRPPSRPARGGLRHVNHDTDARAKLLMARPKTAIPSHIQPSEYARECIEAAVFCRLPPYSLDPAEHQLLRTHINHVQVTTYLNVRNGILRLWMLNPTIAVCREEALGVAKEDRHLEMAAKCHEFLVRHGYINFGCIVPPWPLGRSAAEIPNNKPMKRRRRVVIVGAGAAGLGCARQLESLFVQFADRFPRTDELPEVVILEGSDRIGGRIHSHRLVSPSVPDRPGSSLTSNSKTSTLSSMSTVSKVSDSSFAIASLQRLPDPAVDLGAQIITGFDNGNPLAPIVKRQLRLRWHYLHDDSLLFNDLDGMRVDKIEDIRAEKLFNEILERASSLREKIKEKLLIEGDRELIDQGREPHGESGRQIAKVEENEAVLPPMPPSPPLSVIRDSPVSNRPSPKPNPQRLRIPALRVLTKMGFELKDGEIKQRYTDASCLSGYAALGDTMKSILQDIQEFVDLSPMDLKLLNWHWANLEYGNATNLNKLSLKHWDQDDGNEFLGPHAMIHGGYGQLTNGLASTPTALDIRFNQCVEKIAYLRNQNRKALESEEPGITITCANGDAIQADAVVVTVSLGVLKSETITFDPALPDQKVGAISRLGFGLLNKVVLVYDDPFWDTEADFIGCLRTPNEGDLRLQDTYEQNRGRFYLIWNCTPSCGRPALVALMAGEAAFQAEEESDDALVNEMVSLLARIHQKESLPRPVQSMVSRWREDPFTRGSYSYIGPEATGEDYDRLGESVDQKLFFAGEATCRTHPATVHGAYMSGLRAASEVLKSFIGKIEMPPDDVLIPKRNQPVRNPLMGGSGLPEVKRRTDPESHRYKARNIRRARFAKIVEECSKRILTELGPRPVPPKKYHPNAFLLFQKDKWDIAKEIANKEKFGDNPEVTDSVTRDEVRASMGKMWRGLPEDQKRFYNEAVEKEKAQYKEEVATFDSRLRAWEDAVCEIKEEMKGKLDDVNLTDEEREMIEAAREEERIEIAGREERESLKRFYMEVGMDDHFPDEEEDQTEDLYLQSDDAVLDHLLRRLG